MIDNTKIFITTTEADLDLFQMEINNYIQEIKEKTNGHEYVEDVSVVATADNKILVVLSIMHSEW